MTNWHDGPHSQRGPRGWILRGVNIQNAQGCSFALTGSRASGVPQQRARVAADLDVVLSAARWSRHTVQTGLSDTLSVGLNR